MEVLSGMRVALQGTPRVCLANWPRSIAARMGIVVPAGQRGPLGADHSHFGIGRSAFVVKMHWQWRVGLR